ncbi:MAG: GGDEF domain-containing protein [Clostridiales bacterium]|nr:GGDEF domain-containing protein [Clostridiales bacterium]
MEQITPFIFFGIIALGIFGYIVWILTRKIKDLTEVEKNYTILAKNYSTITILQEIMVVLGSKIQPSKKLEKINEIFLANFGVDYSTIVEIGEDFNIVKASNIPIEMITSVSALNKNPDFTVALENNTPKYVTSLKTLNYATAAERGVRSAFVFPLYSEDICKGFWLIESISSNAFDSLAKTQLSIIKDNITLILQNNNYAINLENKTVQLETANKKLEEMANRDGLTGAFNKAYMHKTLDEMFSGNRRQASILIMDIDNFKNYNDKNGHMEGDNLLRTLASLLAGSLREKDMLFRFGGEEFVILFPETTRESATMVAERIRQKVEEYKFPYQENQPNGNLTISIGVAFCPDDATTKQELLEIADTRLYKAKSGGRNRVVAN